MVVKDMTTSKGVTISFLDDAYRDKTPAEQEALSRNAQRTAWRIAEAKARREREKENGTDH